MATHRRPDNGNPLKIDLIDGVIFACAQPLIWAVIGLLYVVVWTWLAWELVRRVCR